MKNLINEITKLEQEARNANDRAGFQIARLGAMRLKDQVIQEVFRLKNEGKLEESKELENALINEEIERVEEYKMNAANTVARIQYEEQLQDLKSQIN